MPTSNSTLPEDTFAQIQPNGLDLAAIAPNKGTRFSPNLHRWLSARDKSRRAWMSRVYRDADGTLWIGFLDAGEFFGTKLYSVLCNGAQQDTACWVNLRGLAELPDFWAQYMRVGRCAIDPAHERSFIGDDTRWLVRDDTRSCQWCGGAQQVLRRWTEVVERQEWRASTAAGPQG